MMARSIRILAATATAALGLALAPSAPASAANASAACASWSNYRPATSTADGQITIKNTCSMQRKIWLYFRDGGAISTNLCGYRSTVRSLPRYSSYYRAPNVPSWMTTEVIGAC
ncbi:hypothetical protein [Streptosporangium sp. CA-115845]|uniref:hypothetical protein n=1 Tax=Streptosporangium sp. CA-115845 TaxID=3240071 RepID=UPI003D8CB248